MHTILYTNNIAQTYNSGFDTLSNVVWGLLICLLK